MSEEGIQTEYGIDLDACVEGITDALKNEFGD